VDDGLCNLGEYIHASGLADPDNLSSVGSRQESWATPQASDHIEGARTELTSNQKCLGRDLKQWATPNTMDHMEPRPVEAMKQMLDHGQRKNRKWSSNVREQVVWDQKYAQAWATPMGAFGGNPAELNRKSPNTFVQAVMEETTGSPQSMKLNPRWVETLMGLPVGWVMPSCVNPITPQAETSQSMDGGNWPTASTMDVITPTRDLLTMESKGHWGKQPRQRPDGIGFIAPNTGKLSEMVHYTSPVTTEPTNSDSSETELFLQQQNSPLELSGRN